jgi:hypothetical protein
MNRQKLILLILALLLLVSVLYSYVRFPRQKTVAKLTHTAGETASPGTTRPADGVSKPVSSVLRMDLFEAAPTPVAVIRNLFQPVFIDEAARNTAPGGLKGKGMALKPPPPPPPPPPPTPQEIARQMLGSYKSLGMMRKGNNRIAFLARGEEVMLVRIGDKPIPGYSAVSITDEQLTLRSLDGTDELHLALQ